MRQVMRGDGAHGVECGASRQRNHCAKLWLLLYRGREKSPADPFDAAQGRARRSGLLPDDWRARGEKN
jgi:hypothetical protein